jgi:hypothetical protein
MDSSSAGVVAIHEERLSNCSQCPINAVTGHVGTGTNLSGKPTYQDLAATIVKSVTSADKCTVTESP